MRSQKSAKETCCSLALFFLSVEDASTPKRLSSLAGHQNKRVTECTMEMKTLQERSLYVVTVVRCNADCSIQIVFKNSMSSFWCSVHSCFCEEQQHFTGNTFGQSKKWITTKPRQWINTHFICSVPFLGTEQIKLLFPATNWLLFSVSVWSSSKTLWAKDRNQYQNTLWIPEGLLVSYSNSVQKNCVKTHIKNGE